MNTFLIILTLAAVAVGVVYFFTKSGKIKDTDGDLIPDVVENATEKVKAAVVETKQRVAEVKEQVKDVAKVAQKLTKEVKEVADAAVGNEVPKKKKRYYKPKTKQTTK